MARRRRGKSGADAARNLLTPQELAARLREGERLLGLDVGEKTIGLAISDALLMTATPLKTLKRAKFGEDARRIIELARRENVAAFIVGHPLNMNGTAGPRAQSVRAFARRLSEAAALPVLLWDERLSTSAVENTLLEADVSRARRARVVDKLAASWILQGLLDHLRQMKERGR